jgi:hypothetical protein
MGLGLGEGRNLSAVALKLRILVIWISDFERVCQGQRSLGQLGKFSAIKLFDNSISYSLDLELVAGKSKIINQPRTVTVQNFII